MSRYREWDLSCKVYVGNLGSSASKHEIENAFSQYGPLRNVWVARNPPGFAFVEFEDPRDAEDAVRGLHGKRCCGTRVRVEMSSGRSRRAGGGRRAGPKYSRSRSRSPRRRSESRYSRFSVMVDCQHLSLIISPPLLSPLALLLPLLLLLLQPP
ncbi:RNA-binding protein 1-like isoform X3 [Cotesia glomerata]|uniref:RNA-binding protein 1-like isoform X3 n=1 Tax=Cotesia glomerata TaxID=32391 RepID=UPI001D005570|nr:RNA-binding protein 1-like isoform X3 [Cotesia glomerata]